MNINSIKTAETFESLFPIDNKILNAVCDHMEDNGYDESQPIVLWQGKNIVIDGHTRLLTAQTVGIENVPVYSINFACEDEALKYAIHIQRDRRNLEDKDLIRLIAEVDKRKETARDESGKFSAVGASEPAGKSDEAKSKGASETIDRSADVTAEIVGTSSTKVKKARTVIDHADEETKQEVATGDKTINRAYQETQDKRTDKKQPTDEIDTIIEKAKEINTILKEAVKSLKKLF